MNRIGGITILVGMALFAAFALFFAKGDTPGVKAKREFRDALVAAIEGSSRIEVVEHSYFLDFLDPGGSGQGGVYSSDEFPVVEYARVSLEGKQRADLLGMVRAMDLSESLSISFCAFSPHHTIEFHSESGLSSKLAICFGCGKLQWSEKDLDGDPNSWVEDLESFIGRLGMQPNADWSQRLKESGRLRSFLGTLGAGEGS